MDQKVIIQSKVRVMWEGWVGGAGEDTRLYVRSGVGQGWPGRISKYLKTFFCAPCVNAELCIRIHLDIIDKNL